MANEPNFRILSFDPGGTTGWGMYSAYVLGGPNGDEYYDEQWLCGQMGPDEHHRQLFAFLELSEVERTYIVAERFDFRGDDRSDINLMSREYMGVIKLFQQSRGVGVVWQWPFEGVGSKSFVQPQNLQNMGIWVVGGASQWVHAMDAYRHLLYFMTAKSNPLITKAKRVELLKRMGK